VVSQWLCMLGHGHLTNRCVHMCDEEPGRQKLLTLGAKQTLSTSAVCTYMQPGNLPDLEGDVSSILRTSKVLALRSKKTPNVPHKAMQGIQQAPLALPHAALPEPYP
jgi:hypothetical protein